MVDLITGGRVLTPERHLEPLDVVFDGARIGHLAPPGTAPTDGDVLDARGCLVAPGFIDTHVHGGRGHNFMDLGDGAAAVAGHLAAGGTTACVATTASTDPATLLESLADLGARRDLGPSVELLGIHLEGPFLAESHRGVHRVEHLRNPRIEEVDGIIDAARGRLVIVTLAPELPGAGAAVARLQEAGVIVSLGHSACTYAQAREAFGHGVSRVTHCFNALPPIHHRAPGPVVAALSDQGVHVEVVGDGRHVDGAMVEWVWRLVGDRLVLVSDGVDAAGLPDGQYRRWEGTEIVLDGETSQTTSGGIAGGAKSLAACVRDLVRGGNLPIEAALVAASEAPARSVGVDDRKGLLQAGHDADLVVLDETTLELRATIRAGSLTYHPEHT